MKRNHQLPGSRREILSTVNSLLSPAHFPHITLHDKINQGQPVLLNRKGNTSRGLIRYVLLTLWKSGLVFDLRLDELQLHVLELFKFEFQFFLRKTDTITFAEPNKPHLLNNPPALNVLKINRSLAFERRRISGRRFTRRSQDRKYVCLRRLIGHWRGLYRGFWV